MSKLTIIFLAAAVLIFFVQMANIFDWRVFAFTPALAFEMPWTFVTSIFLHADWTHLFFNMFALLVFGLPLENRIGSGNFLIIFLLAGILGSVGYMVTTANPSIPAIGMSGSIYGLMGTLAILMPMAMVFVGGFFPMPMIVMVFFWGASEFLGLFVPSGIARGAHLGGLIIGVLYGFYFRMKESKNNPRHRKVRISGYADWER